MISVRIIDSGSTEGAAGMAVVLDQVLAQTAQIKAGVDPAQKVIGGNLIFEVKA